MTENQFNHVRHLSNKINETIWIVLMEFLEDPDIIPDRGFYLDEFSYEDVRLYFVQHK